jgi:hypothetical protein
MTTLSAGNFSKIATRGADGSTFGSIVPVDQMLKSVAPVDDHAEALTAVA